MCVSRERPPSVPLFRGKSLEPWETPSVPLFRGKSLEPWETP